MGGGNDAHVHAPVQSPAHTPYLPAFQCTQKTRLQIERLELPAPCSGYTLSASFGVAVLDPELRFEAAIALAALAEILSPRLA